MVDASGECELSVSCQADLKTSRRSRHPWFRPYRRSARAASGKSARIGLSADDESTDTEVRQHSLEVGVLEGVAVALRYERLFVSRRELGDDPPFLAVPLELLVGVLNPDDRDLFLPRFSTRLPTFATTASRS